MADDDLKDIKKKLDLLIKQHNESSQAVFAYLNAMLQLMADKGITDPEEFSAYLKAYKEQYKTINELAEFEKIMKQFKKKRDEGDKDAGG